MKALVIGATGATGKDLVNLLSQDCNFEEIDIFVRRSYDYRHDKIKEHIVDFDIPEEWKHLVKGDVVFACLGTTLKSAGSQEKQWKIDYDYQYQFAKAANENGVNKFVLVSSSGANSNSKIFYSRMKGKLEEAIRKLKFNETIVFKPGILDRKNTDRINEKIGLCVLKFFNSVGLFKSQKPVTTEILAKAMIKSAKENSNNYSEINLKQIFDLVKN